MRSAADSSATWSTPPARKNFQRCLLIQRPLSEAKRVEIVGEKQEDGFRAKFWRNKTEQSGTFKWPKFLGCVIVAMMIVRTRCAISVRRKLFSFRPGRSSFAASGFARLERWKAGFQSLPRWP